MDSKLKNRSSWLVSLALHGTLAIFFAVIAFQGRTPQSQTLDITVIETPKAATRAVELKKVVPPKSQNKPREVFGLNRKALTGDDKQSVQVKAGNTVTKAPDGETLRPGDADSLPVPSEEYLVTRMPELKAEVRIPYPAAAKKKKIQGAVVMDLLIDASGRVREAKLLEGPDPELSGAALAAVKGFSFTPALIQDKPVAVRIRYAYRFVLEQ